MTDGPSLAEIAVLSSVAVPIAGQVLAVLKHRGEAKGHKQQDRKDLVAELGNQIDREVALREKAEAKVRKAEMDTRLAKEHASELRRLLLEQGVASDDIPTQPWLTIERT